MTWAAGTGGTDATGINSTQVSSRPITIGSVAVGDTICVGVTWDDSVGATSATLSDSLGNSYTQQGATLNASGQRSAVFACIATHAGTPTLTVQFGPTPGTTKAEVVSWVVDQFTGSDASSTVDGTPAGQIQATPTTTTDLLTSGSITTTSDGDLIWSYTLDAATGGNPGAAGTGFTPGQTTASLISKSEWKVQGTHGAVAGTWTAAANDSHTTFAFAITPAAGGGGGGASAPTPPPYQMVIPMRPTAGGFAVGSPFVFRRQAPPRALGVANTINLSGGITPTGALIKGVAVSKSGSVASAGALSRQVGKSLGGTVAAAGSLVKRCGKALAGTVASTGLLAKRTAKTFTGAVSSSGALNVLRVILLSLGGTIALSGSLRKAVGKFLAGVIGLSGTDTQDATTHTPPAAPTPDEPRWLFIKRAGRRIIRRSR